MHTILAMYVYDITGADPMGHGVQAPSRDFGYDVSIFSAFIIIVKRWATKRYTTP